MNVKHSKHQRKYLSQMRAMADTPWPARRFKYPPTFANAVGSSRLTELGTCKRVVGAVKMRRQKLGRLRPRQDVEVRCGGRVFLRRGRLGKRRVFCADCLGRKRDRAKTARIERRITQRFGITRPVEEQRASRLKTFMRKGR